MKQLNKKYLLLVFFVILLFSIIIHLYFDFNEILILFTTNNIIHNYISQNLYFCVSVFIILNSIYIFFLGFGTLSLVTSIILFDPYLALFVCVLSKTAGSTLSILFLSKITTKPKIKQNYNLKFLNKISNYHILNIIILRILPGVPVAVVNSIISLFKIKTYSLIIGSIIGFSISNGIFIFLLSNVKNILMGISRGENVINQYYIIFVIMFIFIIILYNKIATIVKKKI